jgi:hypothetical protein
METGITLEVRGAAYEVAIDGKGIFQAEVDGQAYRGNTLEKLRELVVRATRQSSLDVRFARPNADGTVRYGSVTGIHAGQRALLVRWNDGGRETIQAYNATGMLQPLSYEQARGYSDLVRVAEVANNAVGRFKSEHRLNVWETATKAAAESAAAKTETEDATS